ncbi:hypothetical protein HS1_002317 [Candidatus Desulfofervidus auxilii]|uniref:PLD phosphodiesterase domain-containing protein n=1 Tax=Desulfofervidus auxilii TaxID=1621989 RepID=A0A7U4QMI9_DESA2|nr:phospholipase D-like domain-containing protein [Candidatus Desulfofervidus auxilii]AMM42101.1 hypothetical protein HS1_002317 [Candidatus Desulfofervidus auxilii]
MNKIQLVYHDKESSRGGESPFDKVITAIVRNEDVSIVCPYIGMKYFERIIKLANYWRLITDVEEWICSHNKKERQKIKNFISEKSSSIHHYRDIHAKVVIGNSKAFIGSSNLTEKGITERVEMGVFIEEKELVVELQNWFRDLWDKSESINTQALDEYILSISSLPSYNEIYNTIGGLPSKSTSIKAKLVDDVGTSVQNIIKNYKESHQRLVTCIKKLAPNRKWINDYFDLAKDLIEFTSLKSNDPRLVMSITKRGRIPITINQRYVLNPEYNGKIGLIMPLDYEMEDYTKDGVVQIDDGYFFRNKIREALWVVFERKNRIEFSDSLKSYWKQAVMTELERSKISGFKRFHEPIVYEAIMNISYRKRLLDEIFYDNV